MTWERKSNYHETNGTHNVAAVRVGGVWRFELWRLSDKRMLGWYPTAAEARESGDAETNQTTYAAAQVIS